MVHTTESASVIPRTEVPEVPDMRAHFAEAEDKNVFVLDTSTALKYLGGKAMVTVPPLGISVTVVKLKEIGFELIV